MIVEVCCVCGNEALCLVLPPLNTVSQILSGPAMLFLLLVRQVLGLGAYARTHTHTHTHFQSSPYSVFL